MIDHAGTSANKFVSAIPSLVKVVKQFPLTFKAAQEDGILFHFWALLIVVSFLLTSNVLSKQAGLAQTFAIMDASAVVGAVQSIAPFTSSVAEMPEQVRISLTGDSFVGASTPGALPKEYRHTIVKGETLATIASSYNVYVSDILKLNGIKPEEAARVKVGQVVRVPAEAGEQDLTWLQAANEARLRAQEEVRRARLAAGPSTALTRGAKGGSIAVLGRQTRGSNTYPFGWCTYWVAAKRYVPPRWGNAKHWLNSARAAGWATGSEARAGAIVVTTDNSFYGHVAYVESVEGGSITVSEMNYVRWGVANTRTIPIGSPIIRGYIY